MSAAFGVIAFLITLAGLLVTVGNAGYLAMLSSAAKGKGMSGEPTSRYVQSERKTAGILLAVAVLALVLTSGGPIVDVIGVVLGVGSGVAAYRALGTTRRRFRG